LASDDLLKLTVLSADPILRLLVARLGHEESDLPFAASWMAFKRFMAFPTTVSGGAGTFQIIRNEADGRVLEICFGRQLSEERAEYGGTDTRVVGIHFLFSPVAAPDDGRRVLEIEMWSSNFPSLDDFYRGVEATDAFRFAFTASQPVTTFWSDRD
jgi:hypothetical protein